jgi:hypothetical protein
MSVPVDYPVLVADAVLGSNVQLPAIDAAFAVITYPTRYSYVPQPLPFSPLPGAPIIVTTSPFQMTGGLYGIVYVVNLTIPGPASMLLPANPMIGIQMTVKDGKGDANTNTITISGGTIDGQANYPMNISGQSVTLLFADGLGWKII